MFNPPTTYTFDDLLLVPQHSTLSSRTEPVLTSNCGYGTLLDIPILAAPMNTVCEEQMIQLMKELGAGAVLHRFMDIKKQAEIYNRVKGNHIFAAVGTLKGDARDRIDALIDAGCTNFCIDIANGHTDLALETTEYLRSLMPLLINGLLCNIMAGNVCTGDGALRLVQAGANIIRVGTGSGGSCITRLVTGHGVPQLSAIQDVIQSVETVNTPVWVVADGGIRNSGDIVKALAMRADAVMIGGLLAGTDESPGKTYQDSDTGKVFKKFSGMASKEGRAKWFTKEVADFIPEGEDFCVPYKGSARDVLQGLEAAIKDGLSYSGAKTIAELQAKAQWVRITDNGRREGNANRRLHHIG